jgi:hypothetical protein
MSWEASGAFTVYINGANLGTNNNGGPSDKSASVAKIGAVGDNSRWFDGQIDDVRIYDRALTAEEVGALSKNAVCN